MITTIDGPNGAYLTINMWFDDEFIPGEFEADSMFSDVESIYIGTIYDDEGNSVGDFESNSDTLMAENFLTDQISYTELIDATTNVATKPRYFANMVSASMSYDGDKYYVAGYYDNLMRGLGDDLSTDSFDAVLDFANELANEGYFIKITNTQTGSEVHYDSNVWLAAIENGDVPEDVYEVTM